MYQPGGHAWAFGGAVTVHEPPPQEKAGKIVRCPMLLPWVATTEPRSEMAVAVPEVTVNVIGAPYAQSVLEMLKVGRGS
jgi:hypothetical protein